MKMRNLSVKQRQQEYFRATCPSGALLLAVALLPFRLAHAAPTMEDGSQVRAGLRGELRRQIADPCLRQHWQLLIDRSHPSWPGRLFLVNQNGKASVDHGQSAPGVSKTSGPVSEMQSMLILAGDRVTVVQDSEILRARFEGVALDSAGVGERLRVRLIVSDSRRRGLNPESLDPGPVISVVAKGIGLTQWAIREPVSELETERVSGSGNKRTTESFPGVRSQ